MAATRDLTIQAEPRFQDGYNDRGFAGPVSVYTPAECRRIVSLLGSQPELSPADWPKGNAVSSRLLFDLATRDAILDRVATLLGDDVMLWGARFVRRLPGEVHVWHTDIETAVESGSAASVWIGLEGTNRSSSLRLVSHSHRFGVSLQQASAQMDMSREDLADPDVKSWAQARDPRSELVELDPHDGDAIFFHGRLWHGSSNTNPTGARMALLLQYATPDTPIRIPDPTVLEWPFRFLEMPRPACIMVRGTDRYVVNRMVPAPTHRHGSHPVLSSWIKRLELPLGEDEETGWKRYPVFKGSTRHMTTFGCHASVLCPGKTPHPPHDHLQEELLIMLAGEADLVIHDQEPPAGERVHTLRPGSFVYYPAFQCHTIRNSSASPCAYLMFKWEAAEARITEGLPTSIFSFVEETPSPAEVGPQGYAHGRLFEAGTRHLRKLHAHVTTLQPGGGYPPHVDGYDVAILVLSGTVETLDKRVGPHGVIFYAAGEPHGMNNPEDEPATYLVFEFHGGDAELPPDGPPLSQRLRKRLRRVAGRAARRFPLLRRLAGR